MSELTVELFDSNYSPENPYTKTPNVHGSHSEVTDTNSIQSGVSTEDSEKGEDISFHEIFSQYIVQPMPLPPNIQGLNNFQVKSGIMEIPHGKNLLAVNEQVLNPIHSTGILHQNPLTSLISSPQDISKNLPIDNGNIEENIGLSGDNPFVPDTGNENSFQSTFIPLPSRESSINTRRGRETDISQDKEFTNINNLAPLSPREKLFPEGPVTESAIPEIENSGLYPQKNHNSVQEPDKISDIQKNYHTTAGKDTNPTEIHFSHGELEEIPDINMKELPRTFKTMAQELSTENNRNISVSLENNTPNTSEENKEDGISGIRGDMSSNHAILNTSETNERQDSFGNPAQREDIPGFTSPDTPIRRAGKESSPAIGIQKALDGTQSNTNNSQFNVFLDNKTMSLSESYESNTSYTTHSTFITGMEDIHTSIMEQIFQKIHMVTHGDKSEIKLHLNPPELGSVKIHFTEENDEIEAKIFVDNAEVKAAIENNSHRLKESIATSGVEIHKFEVYIQHDNAHERRSFENFNPGNSQQQKDDGKEERGYYSPGKENINDNPQTEIQRKIHDLLIDYII